MGRNFSIRNVRATESCWERDNYSGRRNLRNMRKREKCRAFVVNPIEALNDVFCAQWMRHVWRALLRGAQRCSSPAPQLPSSPSAACMQGSQGAREPGSQGAREPGSQGAREQRALLQGAQRCSSPSSAAVKQSASFPVRHSCKTLLITPQ